MEELFRGQTDVEIKDCNLFLSFVRSLSKHPVIRSYSGGLTIPSRSLGRFYCTIKRSFASAAPRVVNLQYVAAFTTAF